MKRKESPMEFWWIYLLIGAVAGVLGSMLGVGGGILMVPAMVMFCKVGQKPAAALSLAVMVPMALSSTIQYLCRSEVRPEMLARWLPVVLMAAAAIAGTFLGAELATKYLSGTTLKKIFAVIMVLVAIKMFMEEDRGKTVNTNAPVSQPAPAGASEPAAPEGKD
jgi:uncharacterized membrane protein YfcA